MTLQQLQKELKKKVNKLLFSYFTLTITTIVLYVVLTLGLFICVYLAYRHGFFKDLIEDKDIRSYIVLVLIPCIPLIMAIFGGICVKAVLKPLSKIFKKEAATGREIHRKDYPELFNLLDEIAKKMNSRLPTHVYISDECALYVHYSNLLSGWMNPKSYNLTIGLPSLLSLNKSELKAILSHRLGYSCQMSGNTHNIFLLSENLCAWILDIKKDLYYTDATTMEGRALSLADSITNSILKQYEKIAPINVQHSRNLYFELDKYVTEVAGTEALISALRKLSAFETRWICFISAIEYYCKEEKIIPESLLSLFECNCTILDTIEEIPIRPESIFVPYVEPVTSRLAPIVKNDAIPSTDERCKAILNLPFIPTEWDKSAVADYLKGNFDTYVHEKIMRRIVQIRNVKKGLTNEIWLEKNENIVPDYLEKIMHNMSYTKEANRFSDDEASIFEKSSPFTRENARIIDEFFTAFNDLRDLTNIDKEFDIKHKFFYNNSIYDGKHAPLKEHQKYWEALTEKVRFIQRHCNYWIRIKLNCKVEYKILYWTKNTHSQLSDLSEEMDKVKVIKKKYEKTRDERDFVDYVDEKFKEIFNKLTKNMESFKTLDAIFEKIGVSENDRTSIIDYFTSGRKDLANMIDIYEKLDAIMLICNYQMRGEILSKHIWNTNELT